MLFAVLTIAPVLAVADPQPASSSPPSSPSSSSSSSSAYHLLNPVPVGRMREMNTDRPDLTEGPYTVDAGHLQVEVDALALSLGPTYGELVGATTNVRLGVLPTVDVHLILPGLGVGVADPWLAPRASPVVGDLLLRAKVNLIGDDGGDFALALLPYLALTADLSPYGGLIVPMNIGLPADFELGAMVEADLLRDAFSLDGQAVVSASLSHPIVFDIGAYLELYATGRSRFAANRFEGEVIASAGVTRVFDDTLELDAGVRVPFLTGDPRFEAFVGCAFRR